MNSDSPPLKDVVVRDRRLTVRRPTTDEWKQTETPSVIQRAILKRIQSKFQEASAELEAVLSSETSGEVEMSFKSVWLQN